MLAVVPGHREPKTIGEKVAWRLIRMARWTMDRVTGMEQEQKTAKKTSTQHMESVVADKPLTEQQWVRSSPTHPPLSIMQHKC